MKTDFLIVGQGICGSFLSWYLQKAGISFLVIDDPQPNTASVSAAGIINPVTGRRIVKTWIIDEVLPFARDAYAALGEELQIKTIEQKNIVDFFPTAQMRQAFLERYEKEKQFLSLPEDENNFHEYFNYHLGYGVIDPCYLVNLPELLPAWRNVLRSRDQLIEEKIDYLGYGRDRFNYKDIQAKKIFFCDGIASAANPLFSNLPFAPNKGEMLLIEAPGLPAENIFKRGINLVPYAGNIFWVGSSYEWEFTDDQPTHLFRERTEAMLKHWLKVPFKVIDHRASIRPATLERRPFIGFHPLHENIGIFNGMGTKGCSLAPFFANQFVQHILHETPLHPEADIKRFQRILLRDNF